MVETTKRRTHTQARAAKLYPRLYFLGGDGPWVVLAKCHHDQTDRWRYRLCATQDEAELLLAEWSITGCGSRECLTTQHRIWKIT